MIRRTSRIGDGIDRKTSLPGSGARAAKEHGYTFAHTYPAFVREAYRVLRAEGVLFAKITDYIHKPPVSMGAYGVNSGRATSGIHSVRLHYEGPERADYRSEMEDCPSQPPPALLLDYFSKIASL
jgi:hypothetical protein